MGVWNSPPAGGMGNLLGWIFFIRWWEPEEEWFWSFELFSKLKPTFCEYWALIKIKISMTCVYKEYEVKIKMVQEWRLQLKMNFLLGYNMKFVIEMEIFPCGGEWVWGNFWLVGGLPSDPPSKEENPAQCYLFYISENDPHIFLGVLPNFLITF